MPAFVQRLVREPLLHFIVFGALIFLGDHLLAARRDDPRLIRMGADVDREVSGIFREAKGRAPGSEELAVLRERWLDNEILYREGLALGVDRGDTAIRERVIFKALNVLQANLRLPDIDDAGLRAWFEKHRDRYDQPTRVDFLEAVLVGDKSAQAAHQFAEALNAGTRSDTESGLRVFRGRPRDNIVTSFGEDFAKALETIPSGRWTVLAASDGNHIVRVDAVVPGRRADYDTMRNAVRQDWVDLTMQELRTAAVKELAKKYTVSTDGTTP